MNQDTELDVFKREIDMRQFALSLGYEMDRRESWRGSTVLRRGADKIVVKRNRNGHYVFFSVRDDRDNGTLIDFLQRRQNLSLGAVRQIQITPDLQRMTAYGFTLTEGIADIPDCGEPARAEARRTTSAPTNPFG